MFDDKYKGMSWNDIESNLIFPDSIEVYNQKYAEVKEDVIRIIKEISKIQNEIDKTVCMLYDIKLEDVEEAINDLF